MEKVITSKNWKYLVKNFLPVNFADSLSLIEGMRLAGNLIIAADDEMEKDVFTADLMKDFSVNLMIILRAKNPKEWDIDWKNEAFLGIACASVYREEEGFSYVKNAHKKLDNPPQSLIFVYASLGSRPDPHLTESEISHLIKLAVQKGVTYESAQKMALLAKRQGDQKNYEYWKKKELEAEKNKLHTPINTPNILKDMFVLKEGYHHED